MPDCSGCSKRRRWGGCGREPERDWAVASPAERWPPPLLSGLKVLHLAFNDLGRDGIWALIDSPFRDPNCDLNLCGCGHPPESERKRIRERLGAGSLDLVQDWAGDRLQPL
jgi:hypothetical protein